MSIEAEQHEGFDRWEKREEAAYRALPPVLLAVCTLITLLRPLGMTASNLPAVLALVVVTAAWLALPRLVPEEARSDRRLLGAHFAGLTLLAAALVALAPWFGIFAFVGYIHAVTHLHGPWRYLGVAATAMILAASYLGGFRPQDPEWPGQWLVLFLVGFVLASGFIQFAHVGEQRNQHQNRTLAALHEANARLEDALAENAGLQAQLLVQAREAGMLDERRRMAREIHDTMAQSLVGVLAQLEAAEQAIDDRAAVRRHTARARDLARESLTEARRTVHAVQPSVLAEVRLPDALQEVSSRWTQSHGIPVRLRTTGDPRPLHTDVEVALLRTAQEALANVAKHAAAEYVHLTLSYMEAIVSLDVRDDGVGFTAAGATGAAPASGPSGGFGLIGMRQRVQRLAGRLEVESAPGEGTVVSASVPAIPAVTAGEDA